MSHQVHAVRYRRLTRRAVFLSFAAVICGGLSAMLKIPDFYMAGCAFILAAVSNGVAGLYARRMAILHRSIAVRALRP